MAKQVIDNGESGLTIRGKINSNFTEIYNAIVALEDSLDNIISGTVDLVFSSEDNTTITTILNVNISIAAIKSISFIPIENATTFLDDFYLNGVTFNIQNIVDGVSFDILATASNNASGIYTITYKILY